MGGARVVAEDELLKALGAIEAELQKGEGDKKVGGQPSMPNTTAEANGALGQEGDTTQLAQRSAAALDAYVNKAMADSDDEDDSDDDEDEETSKSYADDDDEDEDVSPRHYARKSLGNVLKSQLSGSETLDVLPFLESLVDQVSDAEETLNKSVVTMRREQRDFNGTLAKALAANCQMVLALKKQVDTLMAQPVGQRKSVLAKSEINQRFAPAGDAPQYSRDDVLGALEALCKSDPQRYHIAVSKYEQFGTMDPPVQKAVLNQLSKSA